MLSLQCKFQNCTLALITRGQRRQWLLTSNRLAVSSSSSCSSWFLTCDRRSHSLSFSFSSWDVLEKRPRLTRRDMCTGKAGTVTVCQHTVDITTFFAASSCSRRISDPFSLISFSLCSSEELRSRERLPWSLPEVGSTWPPPSSLVSGSGSRSTKLKQKYNQYW